MVIGCSRDLFQVVPVVPDSVRKRVAGEAAEQAVRRPFLPIWLANPLRPALAGATAAAALLVLGLILGRPDRPVPGPAVESPVRLEMHVQQDGTVRLAWQDGRREVYTVRKSADPRGLAAAETHRVRGNSWVDENPTSSPVVFYQVN